MKQKILVTGSNGQLGKELQRKVKLFPQFEFRFVSKEELDIQDKEAVRRLFQDLRPQYLINCAAYTAVDKAEDEKEVAFRVNAGAVGGMAAVCKEFDARFIHISTDYVFNGQATTPYKEEDEVDPQNVYGASKLEGERLAREVNAECVIIRTSWVYSEYGKNFVKTMLRLLSEKEEISVVNDQMGSPTYAADLADAIMHIFSSQNWHAGIYHFSNEGIISWYQFADEIRQITASTCMVQPIPTSKYPTRAARPSWSVLDNSKIREAYGIRQQDWRESLVVCLKRLGVH